VNESETRLDSAPSTIPAGLLGHRLDRLELLTLHNVEFVQDPFGLAAHHALDLLPHTVGGADRVGQKLPQLVKKSPAGLRHVTQPPKM
jgi:hypothetical protein